MSDKEKFDWIDAGRAVRAAYDALPPGDRAVLRRAHEVQDLYAEGVFWGLVARVPERRRGALATLVWCFKACDAARLREGTRVEIGDHARRALGDSPTGKMRFRQLVAAQDEDELARRLRQLLTQCAAPADWGVVARDLAEWRFEPARPRVRRRWAERFYMAPAKKNPVKRTSHHAGASKESA